MDQGSCIAVWLLMLKVCDHQILTYHERVKHRHYIQQLMGTLWELLIDSASTVSRRDSLAR